MFMLFLFANDVSLLHTFYLVRSFWQIKINQCTSQALADSANGVCFLRNLGTSPASTSLIDISFRQLNYVYSFAVNWSSCILQITCIEIFQIIYGCVVFYIACNFLPSCSLVGTIYL